MPGSNTDSMTTRKRNALTWRVLAGAAVLLLLVSLVAGSSGRVCAACHPAQSKSLASGGHANVGCYACHLEQGGWGAVAQKTDEVTLMYPLALIGAGLRDPARMTSRAACLQCHDDILEGVTQLSGLRIKHAVCAARGSCDTCHSTVPHGSATRWKTAPVMEDCTGCHEARGATLKCESCHVARNAGDARGPWQVTHGPNWKSLHGMGQLDSCATCHASDFCGKCHGLNLPHPTDFGGTHGVSAMKDRGSCETCHKTSSFCDACHGIDMPHPSGFLARHSKIAKNDHDPACTRCHVPDDCGKCHSNHVHPGGSKGLPAPRVHLMSD